MIATSSEGNDMLELAALSLAAIHLGVPLAYYLYAKTRWLPKPWGIRLSDGYRPKVTVIVPTYREAGIIEGRLSNIRSQDYPRDLMEVIVIDSGSDDGTAEVVEEWASQHGDVDLKLIREGRREGKAKALNHALKHASGDIVIIADADAVWPSNSIKEAVKWLADPEVGAVSCLKRPNIKGPANVEEGYRHYYNVLRIAESKAYSTPIFHGELAAFRKDLLDRIGGFPTDIGADDSHTAARIALMGYRAIIPEGLWIEERVPKRGYGMWRVRRAQHLIQHFIKLLGEDLGTKGRNKEFRKIVKVEAFLHLINPWILLIAFSLLLVGAAQSSLGSVLMLTVGVVALVVRMYRVWVLQQLNLLVAALRNLVTRELVWSKQAKV